MKVHAEIVGFLLEIEEEASESHIILELKIPGQSVAPGTFLSAKDLTVAHDFILGDLVLVDLEPPS